MKSRCLIILFVLFSLSLAFSEEQEKVSQKDIDEFLAFAGDYIALAEKYIKNANNRSISDIFYSTENSKWFGQTEIFLKKAGWSFDKMNQFLYTVYLALLANDYAEQFADLAEEGGTGLFDDIPDPVKKLVKANQNKLEKYFPKEDYSVYEEEQEEAAEAGDASKDPGDKEAEKPGPISGEIGVDLAIGEEIKVSVKFVSGAKELVLNAAILSAGKETARGEPKTVKPWTVKGGRIENTWIFAKKDLKPGRYSAAVTITDKDGKEAGSKEAEFEVK